MSSFTFHPFFFEEKKMLLALQIKMNEKEKGISKIELASHFKNVYFFSEREGFEPPVTVKPRWFSKPEHSTTLPPFHKTSKLL